LNAVGVAGPQVARCILGLPQYLLERPSSARGKTLAKH
jgi:hypothetical protein